MIFPIYAKQNFLETNLREKQIQACSTKPTENSMLRRLTAQLE